jgi:plasmid stabilization system protein ParE
MPEALADLEAIRLYIERRSEESGDRFVARIFEVANRLSVFPESGRIVPEYGRTDLRELVIQNYRLVYWLNQDEAQIVTVVHGSRPLDF